MYNKIIKMSNPISASKMREVTSERIYERNIPSAPLQPYLNSRPVSTKYSFLPVVDPRKPIQTPLQTQPIYNTKHTFNPGNATAPYSGYADKVHVESQLRNQVYALQRSSQAVYVPSSHSDLYNEPKLENVNQSHVQPFPRLFEAPTFNKFDPTPPKLAHQTLFQSSTRSRIGLN